MPITRHLNAIVPAILVSGVISLGLILLQLGCGRDEEEEEDDEEDEEGEVEERHHQPRDVLCGDATILRRARFLFRVGGGQPEFVLKESFFLFLPRGTRAFVFEQRSPRRELLKIFHGDLRKLQPHFAVSEVAHEVGEPDVLGSAQLSQRFDSAESFERSAAGFFPVDRIDVFGHGGDGGASEAGANARAETSATRCANVRRRPP